MVHLFTSPLPLLLSLLPPLSLSLSLSLPPTPSPSPASPPPPLVIWHGLGDNYANEALTSISELYNASFPGTSGAYTHVISLASTPSADRTASFLGNLTTQIDSVCDQLATHPLLRSALAINALGFSQGGAFLRAYVERCNSPPVANLITFGSPHNGIAEFQACDGPSDWVCWSARSILRGSTWSDLAQGGVVPAQYFRDPATPEGLESYLNYSNFLADVNNERPAKNETYKRNLGGLRRLVMYLFEEDTTVVPKESAWWSEVNRTSGDVTPLRERECYRGDWVGLRTLDETGGLVFRSVPGRHMHLTDEILLDAFTEYFAPEKVGEEEDEEGKGWEL